LFFLGELRVPDRLDFFLDVELLLVSHGVSRIVEVSKEVLEADQHQVRRLELFAPEAHLFAESQEVLVCVLSSVQLVAVLA